MTCFVVRYPAVLWALLPVLSLLACSDIRTDRAHAWADAINEGNLDGAVTLLANDARFERRGEPPLDGAYQIRGVAEWDIELNTRLTLHDFRFLGDTLVCSGTETNDWLTATGIGEITYAAIRLNVRDKQITSMIFELSEKSAAFEQEALAAITSWAARVQPARLDQVMPDGVFRRSGENARLWMALFRDFQKGGTES